MGVSRQYRRSGEPSRTPCAARLAAPTLLALSFNYGSPRIGRRPRRRHESRHCRSRRIERNQPQTAPSGHLVGVNDDLVAVDQGGRERIPVQAKVGQHLLFRQRLVTAAQVLLAHHGGRPPFTPLLPSGAEERPFLGQCEASPRLVACLESLALGLGDADLLQAFRLGLANLFQPVGLLLSLVAQGFFLRLVDELIALLHRPRDIVIGGHNVLRRMQVVQVQPLQIDAHALAAVVLAALPQTLERGFLKVAAIAGQQLAEGPPGDRLTQHGLSGAAEDGLGIGRLEKVGARIGDAVTERALQLDEVAVAGDHDGFLGHPADALISVWAAPGAAARHGRAAGESAEANLDGMNTARLQARHRLDGPRPAPVQTRIEVLRQWPAEAAHHADLFGTDRVQSAQAPAAQTEQHESGEDRLPLVRQPVKTLVDVEAML